MAFDKEDVPGVYNPSYPPPKKSKKPAPLPPEPSPSDTSGGQERRRSSRISWSPTLEDISQPEPQEKRKKGQSRRVRSLPILTQDIKGQTTSFLKSDVHQRLTHITPQDLEQDDLVPPAEDEEPEPNCCNIIHYISDEFQNPRYKAIFMAKSMTLMSLYLIPAICLTSYILFEKKIHYFLSKGWALYMTVSWGMWIGIHVAGWHVRNFRVTIVLFIIRSLAFANAVAALTLTSEILVTRHGFVADFTPQHNGTIDPTISDPIPTSVLHRVIVNGTAVFVNDVPYLERYIYTPPYLWVLVLLLKFLIFTTITLILYLGKSKINPTGAWFFGIGSMYIIPALIFCVVFLGLFEYGRGPRLWDISQIFVSTLLTQFETLVLPMRWIRLFNGKSFYVTPRDYIYVTLWLSL